MLLFGFVRFTSKHEVTRVIEIVDSMVIRDCKIQVEEAAYLKDRSYGPKKTENDGIHKKYGKQGLEYKDSYRDGRTYK